MLTSAQKALAGGQNLSALPWLRIANGMVTDLDFDRYVRFATRMKVPPAFDSPDLASPENDLFGNETTTARHFTRFGQQHSTARGPLAELGPIRQMNAMSYIGAPGATTSTHWRIRHGSVDRCVWAVSGRGIARRGRPRGLIAGVVLTGPAERERRPL